MPLGSEHEVSARFLSPGRAGSDYHPVGGRFGGGWTHCRRRHQRSGRLHRYEPIRSLTIPAPRRSAPNIRDALSRCPPGGALRWRCGLPRLPPRDLRQVPARIRWGGQWHSPCGFIEEWHIRRGQPALRIDCPRRAAHSSRRRRGPTRLCWRRSPRRFSTSSVPGCAGHSYLFEDDGYLFQSPISWYSGRHVLDLSPGYRDRNSHFDRPGRCELPLLSRESAEPVEGTVNRYREPIFAGLAIGCERCHGPGELHVKQPGAAKEEIPS